MLSTPFSVRGISAGITSRRLRGMAVWTLFPLEVSGNLGPEEFQRQL
jgi:hypothetical protein